MSWNFGLNLPPGMSPSEIDRRGEEVNMDYTIDQFTDLFRDWDIPVPSLTVLLELADRALNRTDSIDDLEWAVERVAEEYHEEYLAEHGG